MLPVRIIRVNLNRQLDLNHKFVLEVVRERKIKFQKKRRREVSTQKESAEESERKSNVLAS